ncbi:MAG: MltA domain-containing protein [Leucothrix sp.]
MRLYPLTKVVLAITSTLLLSSFANAFTPVFPENQFASNDRYNRNTFSESDFLWKPNIAGSVYEPVQNQQAISGELKNSLFQMSMYLRTRNPNQVVAKRGANLPIRTLSHTLNSLLKWRGKLEPQALQRQFDLLPLARAGQQRTKFTGYYTPIIKASAQPNAQYRYPIYRSPMAGSLRKLPRNVISQGALRNKGLEVAWTNDPVGFFYMQIQGSGIIEYQNGQRLTLMFDGSNEKPFRSLAKHMQKMGYLRGNLGREAIQNWLQANPRYLQPSLNSNPRYVYFKPSHKDLITASGMPIVPGLSVAIDTNYIPFGSVLLAEVPIKNTKGQTLGSEWKILLPQDRGIAIKGPARMDIYTGKGEAARRVANRLTGLGKAFLLQARQNTLLSTNQASKPFSAAFN